MQIDENTVKHIATLAKLELNEQELLAMQNDLSRVLDFVDKLKEIDTENVEPLIYMSEERNVLRPDVVHLDITQKDALKNAPDHDSDYFKVPKVLGE